MKDLPVGRQNFSAIIERDLLYVDKTQHIHNLIQRGNLYFLSRPRRFGKSLTISTLRYIFEGRKELFTDLYIGQQTDYEWKKYPVVQFNFSMFGHRVSDLEASLDYALQQSAEQYDIVLPETSIALKFDFLVRKLSAAHGPAVILIDEYDKPIVDFLTEPEKAKANQVILRSFFSTLKELDAGKYLHFLFITGVSKFSKVSLFSDLNNLTDLSAHPYASELTGITELELLGNFDKHISTAVGQLGLDRDTLLKGIRIWYNGYSFDGKAKLYNPFSLLHFFQRYEFGNYWFATGTPTFLVKSIRDWNIQPAELENKKVASSFFDKYSLEELDMVGLLYQTGYLTIKRIEQRVFEKFYYLDYPNYEVRNSFMYNLIESFTYKKPATVSDAIIRMREGLENGNVAQFVEQLKILLSDISYQLHPKSKNKQKNPAKIFAMWEGYFQTIIYLVVSSMQLYVQTEISKHKGRLDLLAQTDDYLYLMEFKLDESSENAIAQIKKREYAAAYKNSPKTTYLVGINFSQQERNVKDWAVEVWDAEETG